MSDVISNMPTVQQYVGRQAKLGNVMNKTAQAEAFGLSPSGITKLYRRLGQGANIRVDERTVPMTLWEKQDPWRRVG